MIDLLKEIDDLLARLEDTQKGELGNEITRMRGKIDLIIWKNFINGHTTSSTI